MDLKRTGRDHRSTKREFINNQRPGPFEFVGLRDRVEDFKNTIVFCLPSPVRDVLQCARAFAFEI